jgi:hypothetical protein
VDGTHDDRTFMLEAARIRRPGQSQSQPPSWSVLRIAPGTAHPYQLTRLSEQAITAPANTAGTAAV